MKLWSKSVPGTLKLAGIVALLVLMFTSGYAQEAVPAAEAAPAAAEAPKYADLAAFAASPGYSIFTANNIWMMLATGLVFIMHLGFATVESGLTQSKNTVNILFKNTLIPCIGLLTYALMGFNLMYPGADFAGKWFGFAGFGVSVGDDVANLTDVYNAGYTYWTDFLGSFRVKG